MRSGWRRSASIFHVLAAIAAALVVSTSACNMLEKSVAVSDVRGISYTKARKELRTLGLDVRRTTVASAEPTNTVVRQSIRPGRSVDEGAVIRLSVSDGTLAADSQGTFADVFEEVSDGVMRVETTACDSGGHGSGFLIAPNLVLTVAHVVSGGVSIVVSGAKDVAAGEVIGIDEENDLALVQTGTAFAGHVFDFADDIPPAGADVAVIGYPEEESLSITKGSISGLDRVITVTGGRTIDGVIQTDAAINPGNSGGPLVDVDGNVIGLADAKDLEAEGIAFAVSATVAQAESQQWRADPQPADVPDCQAPVGPGSAIVASDVAHADLSGLLDTLQNYFDGINLGRFTLAYEQFSPERQSQTSPRDFRNGVLTSYVFDVRIRSVEDVDAAHDRVLVTFWSVQQPEYGPDGQDCTRWTLDYSMVTIGGRWFIEGAEEHGADGSVAC